MNIINIYQYTSPRLALIDFLDIKQNKEEPFSVRKWSRIMGRPSHTLLMLQLQGKRKIKISHALKFAESMELNDIETLYFKGIIQLDNAKTLDEKTLIQLYLESLNKNMKLTSSSLTEFKVIADWIHMAILAMGDLKNFKRSISNIKEILPHSSSTEISAAIERLITLGLLEKTEDYDLKNTCQSVSTKSDVKDEGARKYLKQTIDLARNAVDEQDLLAREMQAFSMAVAKNKIGLAKEMIRKFRLDFRDAVSGDGDYIYQTNIQFFQLSKCRPKRKDDEVAMDNLH